MSVFVSHSFVGMDYFDIFTEDIFHIANASEVTTPVAQNTQRGVRATGKHYYLLS